MAGNTKIEWADAVWNPTTGCTRVSEGCRNCYAFALHDKRHAAYLAGKTGTGKQYAKPFRELQLFPERLDQPFRWQKPRRIFVNSMSDLFHKDVSDEFIGRVYEEMRRAEQHTFQILTKRPDRAAEFFESYRFDYWGRTKDIFTPAPNVWLGTSAENQATWDERIPELKRCPAAVHFASVEPLLGPIKVDDDLRECSEPEENIYVPGLDWIIVGGESGKHARPVHPAWVRAIRDACAEEEVPFFFKQWGEWQPVDQSDEMVPHNTPEHVFADGTISLRIGKKKAGRMLDGRTWDGFPAMRCHCCDESIHAGMWCGSCAAHVAPPALGLCFWQRTPKECQERKRYATISC